MRTARMIFALTLTFIVVGAAYVSAQQAAVGQDVKSLAGKWVGFATPTTGSNFPIEVEVKPDGTYTSQLGSTQGTGTITMDGGKLMVDGSINGHGAATAGARRSEITVSSKDGKQTISGIGRDNQGPYNYQLIKK
jgi:hypothetical protein